MKYSTKKDRLPGDRRTMRPRPSAAEPAASPPDHAATIQIPTCVSPTAPTPMILPASISSGLIVASSTSNTRDVFSSMIDRAMFIRTA